MQARAARSDGWRGETDTAEKIERRVAHDLFYIENWSMMLELGVDATVAAHHQKRLLSSRAFSRMNSRPRRMNAYSSASVGVLAWPIFSSAIPRRIATWAGRSRLLRPPSPPIKNSWPRPPRPPLDQNSARVTADALEALGGRSLGFEGRGESFSHLWEKVAS